MKLKCLAIDDEANALEIIETYVSKMDDLELVGKCTNAIDAFNKIQKNHVDLLFLDIQMPKLTGIDLLKNISHPPMVIFTTAYRDYALEGYELSVVDYLLKPISFDRFLKAINKVYQYREGIPKPENLHYDPQNYEEAFVFLKSDKKMFKLHLKDIHYIESMKDYVFVKTDNRDIVTYQKISFLDEKLPSSKFLRIHRSFIIAMDKVDSFSATQVEIANKEIPIGRNYKAQVLNTLNQKNLLREF